MNLQILHFLRLNQELKHYKVQLLKLYLIYLLKYLLVELKLLMYQIH